MDSDTESEGEYPMSPATNSDAQFVLRQPQTTSDLSVLDAVKTLAATASRATSLGSDLELHADVVAASSSLNHFLDDMLQANAAEKLDICASFEVFLVLLKEDFLSTLFTHRRAVYALLRPLGDTSSISVPWTDVLLLKLCRVIALISSGYAPASAPTQLLDAQALWAVRQLPQSPQDLTLAIYSSYSSPGMRKLALQLVFGTCIVRPKMTGDSEPTTLSISLAGIECIAEYYGDTAVRRVGVLNEDEKLTCAMATVLCTTFATKRASDNSFPASRPFFTSLVFGSLHALTNTSQLSLFDNNPFDPVQLILISWGDVLPWCWHSCTDPRSADMPLVSLLTTVWLNHQGRGTTDDSWKSTTLELLMRDVSLSATHVLQLLYRVADVLLEGQGHNEGVTRLAHRVCWSMAQLSDPLLEGHIVFFPDAILHLCTILLHCTCGGSASLDVAELALQALLHSEPSYICAVSERLAEGHEFPSTFDRAVTSMRRSYTQSGGSGRPAQLLLAFLTIFGHRGARLPCYKSTITMLSSSISDQVCAGLQSSRGLAASLAIAAPYLNVGGCTLSEEEILCIVYPEQTQDTGASSTLDLLCAAAVSSYLLCSNFALQSMSSLLKAEVWNALRNALTLTIERRFVGDDEAMSVLIAPLIGCALSRMSACSDALFVEHAIESSWTSSLRSQLDMLLKSDTLHNDRVQTALRARLAPSGRDPLDFAMEDRNMPHDGDRPGSATQLILHSCTDLVFLIPVSALETSS